MKKGKQNEMRKVCLRIAARQLQGHRALGACMAVAVMLTATLFMTAFSAVSCIKGGLRQAEMERAAWMAHGAVMNVSERQYAAMRAYDGASVSSYIHLGYLQEEAHAGTVELMFCEDLMASWMYYGLSWGRMPQGGREIAVSTQLLEDEGLPQETGAEISLRYTVNGVPKEGSFTVCGAYEKKPASLEAMLISEEFCRESLKTAGEKDGDGLLGVRVAEVLFADGSHLEQDMEEFLEQTGALGNKWILNPAFAEGGGMGAGASIAFACVLLAIMACGYSIIYNVCTISVMQDARFYGSLATLGFRQREICSVVGFRTDLLCVAAMPLGLLPGVLLSMAVLPGLMGLFGIAAEGAPGPAAFAWAAAFCYATVKIGSRKPARMAAGMEPALAKRCAAVGKGVGKEPRNGQKGVAIAMAWRGMARGRRKSLLTCGSVMMCMTLSALFYTVASGLDLDAFLRDSIDSDFILGARNYFALNSTDNPRMSFRTLDPSLLRAVDGWEGIEDCGGAGMVWTDVLLDRDAYERHMEIAGEYERYHDGLMHGAFLYGIDQYLFRKMEVSAGSVDWERFAAGGYVVAGVYVNAGGESCWKPGDKVRLGEGVSGKEYTVMAVGELPYNYTVRYSAADSVALYLPMQEWTALTGRRDCYLYACDVADGCEAQWEESLAELEAGPADVAHTSRQTFRDQFGKFVAGIRLLGVSVSVALGTIGLMNFVNVIYGSIHGRRRELAVLQAIGMRPGQVCGMLAAEGGCYMLVSWLAGVVFGMPFVRLTVSALGREMPFFRYRLLLLPYLAFGAACAVLAVCVPILIFCAMDRKEGLLQRLRHD